MENSKVAWMIKNTKFQWMLIHTPKTIYILGSQLNTLWLVSKYYNV